MKTIQNLAARLQQSKAAKVGLAVATGTLTLVQSAHAALPTEATAAFSTVSGNVNDIFTAVWPIVGTVVGGFVLIRLFKKGTGAI